MFNFIFKKNQVESTRIENINLNSINDALQNVDHFKTDKHIELEDSLRFQKEMQGIELKYCGKFSIGTSYIFGDYYLDISLNSDTVFYVTTLQYNVYDSKLNHIYGSEKDSVFNVVCARFDMVDFELNRFNYLLGLDWKEEKQVVK